MTILFLLAGVLITTLLIFGVIILFRKDSFSGGDLRGLMQSIEYEKDRESFVEEVKMRTGTAIARAKKAEELSLKLFRAGYYTPEDFTKFNQIRVVFAILSPIMTVALMWFATHSPGITIAAGFLGLFAGLSYPITILERTIRSRSEEILYYLPLVIEQISIGVSSGLDIGPCIAHIIKTADERGSHNPVTEMFVHIEKLIQAGLNLEDALIEVAQSHGHKELKHAFLFLSQCAKHGGEVSRQLQDLADAVTVQRQIQVEARIVALPVKATGPLALVFSGYFVMIISSLFIKIIKGMGW